MRQFVMGCAVAGFLAISAQSIAEPSGLEGTKAVLNTHEATEQPPEFKTGLASWYGEECEGNLTANGEVFDYQALTAAHPTLPFGTRIKVTNLRNNRSLVLRINDRGPGIPGRLVDLSKEAARRLGFFRSGVVPVRIEVVSQPSTHPTQSNPQPLQPLIE